MLFRSINSFTQKIAQVKTFVVKTFVIKEDSSLFLTGITLFSFRIYSESNYFSTLPFGYPSPKHPNASCVPVKLSYIWSLCFLYAKQSRTAGEKPRAGWRQKVDSSAAMAPRALLRAQRLPPPSHQRRSSRPAVCS